MKRAGYLVFLGIVVVSFSLILSALAQEKKETEEIYTIKQGDTLWGISSKFLQNPFLWPKLWQRNPYIANPHWIYPGQPVRLSALEEPKAEAPKKAAEKAVEPEQPKAPPGGMGATKTEVPPVEKKPEPLVPTLETKFIKQWPFPFPEIRSAGFFSNVPYRGIGFIVESREGKSIMAEGDILYIMPRTREPLQVGDKLTVLRASEIYGNPVIDDVTIGKRYNITGNLQILDKYGEFYVAKVIEAFQEIYKGDVVRPYWKEKMEVEEGDK